MAPLSFGTYGKGIKVELEYSMERGLENCVLHIEVMADVQWFDVVLIIFFLVD